MRYIIERRGNELYIMERQEDGTYKLIGQGVVGQGDALIELARLANYDYRKANMEALVEGSAERHGFMRHDEDEYCAKCYEREDSPRHVKQPRHAFLRSTLLPGISLRCKVCGEFESDAIHNI